MGQVSITINNNDYMIACDDGQEDHLTRLSELVNHRVSELLASVGQVGDTRLLVMSCLLMADELEELREELEVIKKAQTLLPDAKRDVNFGPNEIEELADRLERIAEVLR